MIRRKRTLKETSAKGFSFDMVSRRKATLLEEAKKVRSPLELLADDSVPEPAALAPTPEPEAVAQDEIPAAPESSQLSADDLGAADRISSFLAAEPAKAPEKQLDALFLSDPLEAEEPTPMAETQAYPEMRAEPPLTAGIPSSLIPRAAEPAAPQPPLAPEPMALMPEPEPEPEIAAMPEPTPEPLADPAPAPASTPAEQPRRKARVKTTFLGFERSDGRTEDIFASAAPAEAPKEASATVMFPVGWLAVISGPGRGACATLQAGVSQIGRGDDQAVQLDFGDTGISRINHAAIAFDDEENKFFLGHGGKANIVRLNGKPVLSTEELTNGDEIRISETTLRFIALCDEDFTWADHD